MIEPIPYYPRSFVRPARLLDVPSAWVGVENALACIFADFRRTYTGLAVEIGTDYGYSAAALSNFFDHVTTVDFFRSEQGDSQTGYRDPDQFERVTGLLADFPVTVVCADFRDWIRDDYPKVDCVHADLVHDYQPTYEALRWAVDHTDLVLAHDSRAFPEVMRALKDVAVESGCLLYEWPERWGLGILSRGGLKP